jgi:DNA-binding beta-propeller fold protein YncE
MHSPSWLCATVLSLGIGALYIRENPQHRIHKIAAGHVSTFAGSGQLGAADGPAASASFHLPYGLTFGPAGGLLYVAEVGNNDVRVIDMASDVVSTFAGSDIDGYADGDPATAQFFEPIGISVAPNGEVYVADTQNHRIRVITTTPPNP